MSRYMRLGFTNNYLVAEIFRSSFQSNIIQGRIVVDEMGRGGGKQVVSASWFRPKVQQYITLRFYMVPNSYFD
jgi:hypothetical protein